MNAGREYVRWDYHRNNLQTMFSHQLLQGRFCDVTLACQDGQALKAHRAVLCAGSDYFDTVLNSETLGKETVVIMKDCSLAEIKLIIEFMYHGEISVEHCRLPDLQKTAEYLRVRGLAEALASLSQQDIYSSTSKSITDLATSTYNSSLWKRQRTSNTTTMPNVAIASGSSGIPNDYPQEFLPAPQMPVQMDNVEMNENQMWPIISKNQEHYHNYEDELIIPKTEAPEYSNYDQEIDENEIDDDHLSISDTEYDTLTESERDNLNNVEPSERGDSKFIRMMLEYLYKDDPGLLLKKSIKGKIERTYTNKKTGKTINCIRKRPVTPSKLKNIHSELIRRVRSMDVRQEEFLERTSSRRFYVRVAKSLNYIQKCLLDKEQKSD